MVQLFIGFLLMALGGLSLFFGTQFAVRGFNQIFERKADQQASVEFSPKIDVKVFSTPGISRYKPPLKEYNLMIQNLNKNSATIVNLRIQFMFKNL